MPRPHRIVKATLLSAAAAGLMAWIARRAHPAPAEEKKPPPRPETDGDLREAGHP